MVVKNCPNVSEQLNTLLRPLGITRSSHSYWVLQKCVLRICEQEVRLEAVQKEIYEPIAEQQHCKWTAIPSAIRRAAKLAWEVNLASVQELAGYPLTGCPARCSF